VVEALGRSASAVAGKLNAQINQDQAAAWKRGSARSWAMESFRLSRKDVYVLAARPTCNAPGSVALTPEYQATAVKDAALQLEKAGIRLAAVLNGALAASEGRHR
jgi:hypothetical protein